MGTCISKGMPKRGSCSPSIQDKPVISELLSTASPSPPPFFHQKSRFSDEFLISFATKNLNLNSHFTSKSKPVKTSRSKACVESPTGFGSDSQLSKLAHGSLFDEQLILKDPGKLLLSPSYSGRYIVESPSSSRSFTMETSHAGNASTDCSRNLKGNMTKRHQRPVRSNHSCSCRSSAIAQPIGKRHGRASNLASSSSSNTKTSSHCSTGVCSSSSGSSSTTSSLRTKEICKKELRFELSKASVVSIRDGSKGSKRKKREKVVHPILDEDDLRKVADDTIHSAVNIENLSISLDCFIFV